MRTEMSTDEPTLNTVFPSWLYSRTVTVRGSPVFKAQQILSPRNWRWTGEN